MRYCLKVYLKTKKMTDISQTQAGCKAKSCRNPLYIPRLLTQKSRCVCRNRRYFRRFRYPQANCSGKSIPARATDLFYLRCRGRRTDIILYSLFFIIYLYSLLFNTWEKLCAITGRPAPGRLPYFSPHPATTTTLQSIPLPCTSSITASTATAASTHTMMGHFFHARPPATAAPTTPAPGWHPR